jgi:hypothetical protein
MKTLGQKISNYVTMPLGTAVGLTLANLIAGHIRWTLSLLLMASSCTAMFTSHWWRGRSRVG